MKTRITTNKIVVHCSASTDQQDWGAAQLRRIHVAERGWDDIGYHYVICRDGTVEYGRHKSYVGAHAGGRINPTSIGICLIGGAEGNPLVSSFNYTPAQITALASLIKQIQEEYPEARTVTGHKEVGGSKDCPCFNVPLWWETGEIEKYEGGRW